ncbi:MAG: YbaK/EbsC family protein [Sphaerobacteraceae bacterium]|nr:MAG: YbaK/EbsC family protein [Sphaerobacteraceae bacterium]
MQEFLDSNRIDAEIIVPGADTPTVPAAADALGVRPEQIVKSLVFSDRNDETIIAVVRGTARVDRRKLSKATGLRKPKLAPPELVHEVTGYRAGGTPPVGHREQLTVYIDDAVFNEPVVYAGGGDIDSMLRITPATIQTLTDAVVVDISEDD